MQLKCEWMLFRHPSIKLNFIIENLKEFLVPKNSFKFTQMLRCKKGLPNLH